MHWGPPIVNGLIMLYGSGSDFPALGVTYERTLEQNKELLRDRFSSGGMLLCLYVSTPLSVQRILTYPDVSSISILSLDTYRYMPIRYAISSKFYMILFSDAYLRYAAIRGDTQTDTYRKISQSRSCIRVSPRGRFCDMYHRSGVDTFDAC